MWVRGLKQSNNYGFMFPNLSHPMWVRGLKHKQSEQKSTLGSRTLCGCVD